VKLVGLLRMTSAFLAELEFNRERLAESLRLGGVDATWRMEELVRKGMPLREAHHAVASEHHQPVQPHGHVAADLSRYATTGSARPEETRRVAAELLAWLETPAPR
jgi:argininosuccinate lyase